MEALLRAVNTTNDFENELATRFGDASPAEVRAEAGPACRSECSES